MLVCPVILATSMPRSRSRLTSCLLFIGRLVKHGSFAVCDDADAKLHLLVFHELRDFFEEVILLAIKSVILPRPEAEIVSKLELINIAQLLTFTAKKLSGRRREFSFERLSFFAVMVRKGGISSESGERGPCDLGEFTSVHKLVK